MKMTSPRPDPEIDRRKEELRKRKEAREARHREILGGEKRYTDEFVELTQERRERDKLRSYLWRDLERGLESLKPIMKTHDNLVFERMPDVPLGWASVSGKEHDWVVVHDERTKARFTRKKDERWEYAPTYTPFFEWTVGGLSGEMTWSPGRTTRCGTLPAEVIKPVAMLMISYLRHMNPENVSPIERLVIGRPYHLPLIAQEALIESAQEAERQGRWCWPDPGRKERL